MSLSLSKGSQSPPQDLPYFYFVYECFACMYFFVPRVCKVTGGQKRA